MEENIQKIEAEKDEHCDNCGYPFDTHQEIWIDNNTQDVCCSIKCLKEIQKQKESEKNIDPAY